MKEPKAENRRLLENNNFISKEVSEYRHLCETLQKELTLSREQVGQARKRQIETEVLYIL